MKLVSIIVPAYNAEKYIIDTLNSVLHQTYQNWELIIVNDGSTDNTHQIIESLLPHPKIRYVQQVNSGVSSARNKGMQQAKGDYFSFLDADDCFAPNNLELKITALEQQTNLFFSYSDVIDCDETLQPKTTVSSYGGGDLLNHLLLWDRPVIRALSSNIIIKNKCYTDGLKFDTDLSTAADQMFAMQIASKYKGAYVNKPLIKYRVLTNSMSRNIRVMERDHILVYTKARQLQLFKSFVFQQKCFSNLYFTLAGSWWVNGHDKLRGLFFILRALIAYPPCIFKLLKKIF
jgi:glycosyltransferase involved in cell wall biosynthesis